MKVQREDVVRVPPERLRGGIDAPARQLTRAPPWGEGGGGKGRIVHGDGAVYQSVKYDAVVFTPQLQEIVDGTVVEILKFGAFIRFGPLDGLLHISQVMDDRA